jgi:hypothetical protein
MTEDEIEAQAKRRLLDLVLKSWGRTGQTTEAERAEANELALLLGPDARPTARLRRDDGWREHFLWCKAMTAGFTAFSDAEHTEILELAGRKARFEASPEGKGRARLEHLMWKAFKHKVECRDPGRDPCAIANFPPEEQREYEALQKRWPCQHLEPGELGYEQDQQMGEIAERLEREEREGNPPPDPELN